MTGIKIGWYWGLALTSFLLPNTLFAQGVGIGTSTPNSSAALDVSSSVKGFLPPRMTRTEREAINPSATAAGLLIFNLDDKQLNMWDGTRWVNVSNGFQTLTGFSSQSSPYTKIYSLSTNDLTYKVPVNVHAIQVQATGASGNGANAGYGAQVTAILKVFPGERLTITIGGRNGINGGGAPNGGGGTDLRRDVAQGSTGDIVASRNALLVAGGGGGAGSAGNSNGTTVLAGGTGGSGGGQAFGSPSGNFGNADGSGGNGGPNSAGGAGGIGGFGGGAGGNGTIAQTTTFSGNGGGGAGITTRGNGGNTSTYDYAGNDSGRSSVGGGGGGYLGGGAGTYGGSWSNGTNGSGGGAGGSSWVTPLPALQITGAPTPIFGISQNYGDGQLIITPVE